MSQMAIMWRPNISGLHSARPGWTMATAPFKISTRTAGLPYLEERPSTEGEWYVDDDGRFCSFWPPSYRACYDLYRMVEHGRVVGIQFAELLGGSTFEGRFGPTVA